MVKVGSSKAITTKRFELYVESLAIVLPPAHMVRVGTSNDQSAGKVGKGPKLTGRRRDMFILYKRRQSKAGYSRLQLGCPSLESVLDLSGIQNGNGAVNVIF